MTPATAKDYFDALSCPACSGQVILTKEKIIFCQKCLLGFRVLGGIPDLRLSQAVSFKKKSVGGVTARFTIQSGERAGEGIVVALDHCVLIGRGTFGDGDVTVAGARPATTPLDGHTQKLIETFLARKNRGTLPVDLPLRNTSQIGDFERDPDLVLSDSSVSRLHAVVYQDRDGVWVLDLVSKNGTFVNGKEVESAKLRHGDQVRIGNVALRATFS